MTKAHTIVVSLALVATPAIADTPKADLAQSTPNACSADATAYCKTSCEPRNLVFLPCMAVGATNMASCRKREVAACLHACTTRRCS